jgi:hypothetical protein
MNKESEMDLKRAMMITAAAAIAAWLAGGPSPEGSGGAQHAEVSAPAAQARVAKRALDEERGSAVTGVPPARRSCDIVTHYLPDDEGIARAAYSCELRDPAPPHPYESYPTAALESLAYADPEAAAVLSLRWRQSDTAAAMSMALRAAALSGGDASPVVAFSNAYPAPTAIDDVPVRQTVHVKYVLGTVTKLLGDERHSVPYFEALIRKHSSEPEREIALLQQRANELLDEMRQVQLGVTGAATIGG